MTGSDQDQGQGAEGDHFGLLDMLAVLLENWRLLVFVPLGAGLVALAWSILAPVPTTYQANATVLMSAETAKLVLQPQDLSIMAALPDEDIPPAAITVTAEAPETYRISVNLADQQQAAAALDRLLATLSDPTFQDKALLLQETKVEAIAHRLLSLRMAKLDLSSALSEAATRTEPDADGMMLWLAGAIDDMSNSVLATELTFVAEQQRLNSWPVPKVTGAPTLTQHRAGPSSRVIITFAVLISGFAMVVVIFLRDLWRRAEADDVSREKILRIQRALGLHRPRA